MTDRNAAPTVSGEIAELKGRVDDLERILRKKGDGVGQTDPTFSYSGALAASASPLWVARYPSRLITVVGILGTVGADETVVEVSKNGVVVATLTIAADQNFATTVCSVFFAAAQDLLRFEITSPGSGAEDLTVEGWLK